LTSPTYRSHDSAARDRSPWIGTPDVRRISVIVPIYNSAATLEDLVARLVRVLDATVAGFELVLVDDGSRDESGAVLDRLARRDARLRVISLMRNYGQHNALLCGIRAARYELIVTLDDDLQHPPEEIPKLLATLDGGFDVVYGTARERHHVGWRNWSSSLTHLVLRAATGAQNARRGGPFRLFRTSLRDAFVSWEGSYTSIDVLLTWGTTRFATVPVQHDARQAGRSNYTFRALATRALTLATCYSALPLQIASLLGIVTTLLGVASFASVLIRAAVLQRVAAPNSPNSLDSPDSLLLASVIAICAGAQLIAIGIVGEYVARVHFRVMGRPSYVRRPAIDPSQLGSRNGRRETEDVAR